MKPFKFLFLLIVCTEIACVNVTLESALYKTCQSVY